MNDFKPGLEGVVAVQTEIAEPDREGGALRYRGIDIEELVGHVPYEKVWGLLVDDDIDSEMPHPGPYEPAALSGNAPSDLQAETARLSGVWKLGKLNEISDEQAREDLGRLSAQMMETVARSAAVADGREPAPDEVVACGDTAAEKFLLRWRGEADPRHVKAIDTYWICTAEHGLNASTFTARVAASTGADCGASLSSAVGALSGPLHGGAPAYVKPMLEEVQAMGDPERWVQEALATGKRIMGFGHRIYRAEDPRRGRGAGRRSRRGGVGARARAAALAVGRRARGGGPQPGLPRAGRRLPRDRAVPVPAEARAAAARPRRREPGLPRLGADLPRASLARPPRRRQRRPAAAAPDRLRPRRERRRQAARPRLAQERLAAARDGGHPGRAGGE